MLSDARLSSVFVRETLLRESGERARPAGLIQIVDTSAARQLYQGHRLVRAPCQLKWVNMKAFALEAIAVSRPFLPVLRPFLPKLEAAWSCW